MKKIKVTALFLGAFSIVSLASCNKEATTTSTISEEIGQFPAPPGGNPANNTSNSTTTSDVTLEPVEIDTSNIGTENTKDLVVSTVDGSFLKEGNIVKITQGGTYSLSGAFFGQILVDASEADVILELEGLTITNDSDSPIRITSANSVDISAKKGTSNYVIDKRNIKEEDSDEGSAAIASECDLTIKGKGSLSVYSNYNNGIHTKDDLEIKNLTLTVKAINNALKGNDSITIESGTLDILSTTGDGLKTTNTSLSSKGKQKGTITVLDGDIKIEAACDGISAAYDMIQSGGNLTIHTASYCDNTVSKYETIKEKLYLALSIQAYDNTKNVAVGFINDDEVKFVTAKSLGIKRNGMDNVYLYEASNQAGYDRIAIVQYDANSTPSLEECYKKTDIYTINKAQDLMNISSGEDSLYITSWGQYSSMNSGGRPGPGGMQDGNGNKISYSAKGIKASNTIQITGGKLDIQSSDDAIHMDYNEAFESGTNGKGEIAISGGELTLSTLDDAIHSDNSITISGTTKIKVLESYEGVEANTITFSGGDTTIYSSDDGINASGTIATPNIYVSGGSIDVTVPNGDTDGIDSNGNYTQTGGYVFVKNQGTQGGGMGAFDLDGKATITGGEFILLGAVGSKPTNYAYYQGSIEKGNYVVSSSTEELFSFTVEEKYQNLIVYSSSFISGKTYTIASDSWSKSFSWGSSKITIS